MEGADELLDLGFYDMLKRGNVIVIEWLEKVRRILEKAGEREEVRVVLVDMRCEGEEERRIIWLNG